MRAAIYDPYLDTLGGGERYAMTFASVLIKNGWEVDLEWNDKKIIEKLEKRLGLTLSGVKVVSNINNGKGYDACFWLSDGSIPNLSARKNLLHFQVPFHNVNGKSVVNRIKLKKISKVICNSEFTKKFIDREYGVKSVVVYPPVAVNEFERSKKEDIILFVGRFSQLLQSKRQDVLVDAFKKMVDRGLTKWKLVLAGGSDIGGRELLDKLTESARGYPIEIIENADFDELKKLYAKAKIFWSASGFDVEEEKTPEKVEHFGITVVEAMAAGCAPVIVNKGGHKEIVEEEEDGILWSSQATLYKKTLELVKDNKKRQWISENAQKKAQAFDKNVFENEVIKVIS